MDIILSIHPKWAKLIYEGKKTIEWRKTVPQRGKVIPDITKVFLYETSPVKGITGYFILAPYYFVFDVNKNSREIYPEEKERIEQSCVDIKDLKKYQGENKNIYGLPIHRFEKFDHLETLESFGIKRPPQSWRYVE